MAPSSSPRAAEGGEDGDAPGILLRHSRKLAALPACVRSVGPRWRHADALCHLNLGFNALLTLEGLAALPNLEVLDVSHNRLATLVGVAGLPRLRRLFAHDNRLGRDRGDGDDGAWRGDPAALLPLGALETLEELWVSHNFLRRPSELLRLAPNLRILALAPNGVVDALEAKYRPVVVGLLPRLAHLDALAVSPTERAEGDAFRESTDGRIA